MLEFKIAGKSVDARGFADSLEQAALQSVKDQIRERFKRVRNPRTGEFPTVLVEGQSIESIQIVIEGSKETLALVHQSLSSQEIPRVTLREKGPPKAFLSYATEDRELARRIAEDLQSKGIDTWWAEWEIRAGQSLRQRIEQGLAQCTHFLVLLTQSSISKAWVNQEIDAGLVRMLEAKCTFIPIRSGFAANDLPPLLSGLLSPQIDESSLDLSQLVSDIHGLTRKPRLGEAPLYTSAPATGYSKAATAAVRYFVESSPGGLFGDVQSSAARLQSELGLSLNDAKDAIFELGSLLHSIHLDTVTPKDSLYVKFDRYWKEWDPEKDARKLAADLMNDEMFPRDPREIAAIYQWPARRLNPAIAYLVNRDIVQAIKGIGTGPFGVHALRPNDDTRRFISSRS